MLILVRHGRTAANAAGELLGRRDPSLDDTGRHQALRISRALPEVTRIISSPLTRCTETALEIQSRCRLKVAIEIDERFVEIDYGTLEGMPADRVPVDTWARWQSDPAWSPGGAESLADVSYRVARALDEIRGMADEADEADTTVIVTHVSPIKAAVGWALGMGPEIAWRCHVAQASIHRINIAGGRPKLIEFNRTSHLWADQSQAAISSGTEASTMRSSISPDT